MEKQFAKFQSIGATVLVISMSRPEVLALYLKNRAWPFAVVCDPDRTAYLHMDLERTSLGRVLRPRMIFYYLKLIFQGMKVRKPYAGEDVYQLGGDFVLDRERRVRFAPRSRDPAVRPSIEMLLEQLRAVPVPNH